MFSYFSQIENETITLSTTNGGSTVVMTVRVYIKQVTLIIFL